MVSVTTGLSFQAPRAQLFEPSEVKKIPLNEGESLNVEASAMLACKNVDMQTGVKGSVFSVAKRYFFGGEGPLSKHLFS